MASSIDTTKPETGNATTASVRANFTAAKTEIEALQALAANLNKCYLSFTSNRFLTGNSASNILAWDVEEYDDLGVHSTSVNPSRVTIPPGITRAAFKVGIDTIVAPESALLTYNLLKNGAFLAQIFQNGFVAGAVDSYGVYTAEVPEIRGLVAGDYFEVEVKTTAASNFHGLVGSANRATYLAGIFNP